MIDENEKPLNSPVPDSPEPSDPLSPVEPVLEVSQPQHVSKSDVPSWNAREERDAFRRAKIREKITRFTRKDQFKWILLIYGVTLALSLLDIFTGSGSSSVDIDGYPELSAILSRVVSFLAFLLSAFGGIGLLEIWKGRTSDVPEAKGFRHLTIFAKILRVLMIISGCFLTLGTLMIVFSFPGVGLVLAILTVMIFLYVHMYKLAIHFLEDLGWVCQDPRSDLVPDPKDLGSFTFAFGILSSMGILILVLILLNPEIVQDYLEVDVLGSVSTLVSLGLDSAMLFLISNILKQFREERIPEMPEPAPEPALPE